MALAALARIKQQLKELHGSKVIVGVQGEAGINIKGETLSATDELQMIAHVHEYGWDIEVTPKMRAFLHHNGIHLKKDTTRIHVPERSFIRTAEANGKVKFRNVYHEQGYKMLQGEIFAEDLLRKLGEAALEEISVAMDDQKTPVTQYTLDSRKASPNPTPLVDTGRLGRHITYRIVQKDAQISGTAFAVGGR